MSFWFLFKKFLMLCRNKKELFLHILQFFIAYINPSRSNNNTSETQRRRLCKSRLSIPTDYYYSRIYSTVDNT